MRASGLIEMDPNSHDAHCMLQGLETLMMQPLLLQGPDNAFNHVVLLGAVGRNELRSLPIVPYQLGVLPTSEDQPILAAKQERFREPPQAAVTDVPRPVSHRLFAALPALNLEDLRILGGVSQGRFPLSHAA
jgi:hypothetical protein